MWKYQERSERGGRTSARQRGKTAFRAWTFSHPTQWIKVFVSLMEPELLVSETTSMETGWDVFPSGVSRALLCSVLTDNLTVDIPIRNFRLAAIAVRWIVDIWLRSNSEATHAGQLQVETGDLLKKIQLTVEEALKVLMTSEHLRQKSLSRTGICALMVHGWFPKWGD